MVKVNFTEYRSLATCPKWWQDFVNSTDKNSIEQVLEEHGVLMVDHPTNAGDLICLVFASQYAYDSFRTYWMLRGEIKKEQHGS